MFTTNDDRNRAGNVGEFTKWRFGFTNGRLSLGKWGVGKFFLKENERMKPESYQLNASDNLTKHEFVSIGRRGQFKKIILFQRIEETDFYELLFGDFDDLTGRVDYVNTTDNGDMKEILSTISRALFQFTEKNPDAKVVFRGSTPSRTRLYRIAISKNYEFAKQHFDLFMFNKGEVFRFEPNASCEGFMIARK